MATSDHFFLSVDRLGRRKYNNVLTVSFKHEGGCAPLKGVGLINFSRSSVPMGAYSKVPAEARFLHVRSSYGSVFQVGTGVKHGVCPRKGMTVKAFSCLLSIGVCLYVNRRTVGVGGGRFVFVCVFSIRTFAVPTSSPPE